MFGVINYGTYTLGALLIILLPGPNSMYVLSVAARKGLRTGFRAASGVFLGDTTLILLTSLGAASLLKATPLVFDGVKLLGASYLLFIGYGMLKSARRTWLDRHAAPAEPGSVVPAAPGSTAPSPAAPAPTAPGSAALALAALAPAAPGSAAKPAPVPGPAQDAPVQPVPAEPAPVPDAQEHPFRRALVVSLLNPKAILFLLSFFVQFVDRSYGQPEVSFAILGGTLQLFSCLYLTTLIMAGTTLANAFRRRRRLSAALTTGVAALFIGFAAKLATASAG